MIDPLAKLGDLGSLLGQRVEDSDAVRDRAFIWGEHIAVLFEISDALFHAADAPVAIPSKWIHSLASLALVHAF